MTIIGILKGKNFTAPNVNINDFKISVTDEALTDRITLEIKDDNTMNAIIRIPGKVSKGVITVSYKDVAISSQYCITQ